MHTRSSVNSSKLKIMLVKKAKIRIDCSFMYNNEPLQTMEGFKYLGLELPFDCR